MTKFLIKSGKCDGKIIEADYCEDDELYVLEMESTHDVAADGHVQGSKKYKDKPTLVYKAMSNEKIKEIPEK